MLLRDIDGIIQKCTFSIGFIENIVSQTIVVPLHFVPLHIYLPHSTFRFASFIVMLERRTQRIVSGVSRRAFFAAPARLMATNAAASHFPKRTPPFSRRLLSAPRSYPSLRYGWRPRRRLALRDAGDVRLRLIALPHNIRG